MATSIGNEEQWLKQGLLDLSGAGLEAEFITTNPNSSAYRTAMTLYDQGITSIKSSHLLGGRTGLMVRASDSGSGDPGSILGRVGVLFP